MSDFQKINHTIEKIHKEEGDEQWYEFALYKHFNGENTRSCEDAVVMIVK